jgi:hypothetical protein
MKFFLLAVMLPCPLLAMAQLAVTVTPPRVTGQKAVVQLKMKNGLGEAVKSARAALFLLDDQGNMIGQSTKWVIGGNPNRPALAPGATNGFNFVIQGAKPFATTNLTAKVSFTHLILEGEKAANVAKDVTIIPATAPR